MRLQTIVLLVSAVLTSAGAQGLYPDSAVVIGTSRFGFATGEASGNRVSVRDSQGFIHAVYCYDIGGPYADSSEIYYVYSTDNGLTWSLPENISRTDSLTSYEPDLTIDSQDHLHCVWKQYYEDTTTPYLDVDLYYSKNDGSGWTPAVNISNQSYGANACYSSMVVDSRDRVHVVYDMDLNFSANWDIFYSFYNDTVWSTPYQVSTSPYDDAFPALAIDQNDHLHVVWRQRTTNGPIMYSYYNDITWSAPEVIASIPGGRTYLPCIVIDSQTRPHVTFLSGNLPSDSGEVYYTAFDGSTWSTPLNLSNTVHPSEYSSLAIDSLDHLYVVWSEITNVMNCEIYYRNYNGFSWSSVINLTQDSVYSGCPKLGNPVTGNGVDLVWVHDHIYPELFVLYMRLNPVGIEEESKLQVRSAEFQIYPNPFKNCITFEYDFMPVMPVTIMVYNANGRMVAEIKPDQSPTNHHRVTWSAGDLPSGVYFISMQGGDCSMAKKIIKIE